MSFLTGTQVETVAVSTTIPSAYNTFTSAQYVGAPTGAAFLPSNFWQASYGTSKSLLVKAYGVVSTTGTPNLTLGITANTTQGTYNSSGILATTGAVAQASSITNVEWDLECVLTCTATGASGTVLSMGRVNVTTGTTAVQSIRLSSSSANPNTAATLSTQSAYFIELFATWSASSSSNSITPYSITVLGLN
jgi:hypothetical protein